MPDVFIGLGSNLENRERNIKKAIKMLETKVKIKEISSMYETKPAEDLNQPDFINAVAKIKTEILPADLRKFCKEIESKMGREKTSRRYGPRIIDLDILAYGDETIDTDDLKIPHPKMKERSFVLVPLKEIAPEFIHPCTMQGINELIEKVDMDGIRKLG